LTGFKWRRYAIAYAILFVVALIPLALVQFITPTSPLNSVAQRTANEFDRLLTLRRQQVFSFAALPSIRAFAASAPEARSARAAVALNELQSLVASDKRVREAFIVDQTGRVNMTTLEGWDDDLSNRQFVRQALAGQIAVSAVARDRGEFSNYYAAPILNNNGDVAGALVARIEAQELWGVLPSSSTWYVVLADENGVRLDDTGDPARRLAAFAPLEAERATQVANNQTYGAELPQVRATNLQRAQDLLTAGALDRLRGSDFNASDVAAQRLVSKPWTVLVISSQSMWFALARRFGLPVLAALLLAIGGAFLLERIR
jgi:hypothetical protein